MSGPPRPSGRGRGRPDGNDVGPAASKRKRLRQTGRDNAGTAHTPKAEDRPKPHHCPACSSLDGQGGALAMSAFTFPAAPDAGVPGRGVTLRARGLPVPKYSTPPALPHPQKKTRPLAGPFRRNRAAFCDAQSNDAKKRLAPAKKIFRRRAECSFPPPALPEEENAGFLIRSMARTGGAGIRGRRDGCAGRPRGQTRAPPGLPNAQ